MLSSRIAAALLGAGALLSTALIAAPANAAPIGAGSAPAVSSEAGGLVQQAWHYGRPHYYRGGPRYYGRPVYRPRCFYSDRRVWNGYRWVIRPVRVCR
ncbi:hypothetical protein [Bosea sp. WAO]|uniref:hypothetical protein n=1 Tax=Bosea sp. WAO TaxID=406341 RepID=UPI000832E08D|nr:hypothetical protein [Bosea sp. WAO]